MKHDNIIFPTHLISLADMATRLGIKTTTLHKWIKRGKIKHGIYQAGRFNRILCNPEEIFVDLSIKRIEGKNKEGGLS